VLTWLNDTAVTVLDEPASWAELLGFVTGLACVWLVVRQHIANWPVGIVNVLLLMVAFGTAGLYADASLQIVYVVLGFYGWWAWWRRGSGETGVQQMGAQQTGSGETALGQEPLHVRTTSKTEWFWLALGGLASTVVLYFLLRDELGSTVPLADAITTALSLVATYGQCRKLLENWWIWILADVIYVPLYAYKHLYLTTVLYVVFLTLSVIGLVTWTRDHRGQLERVLVAAASDPVAA
jgi:nicotinamide mononucleotide transporter